MEKVTECYLQRHLNDIISSGDSNWEDRHHKALEAGEFIFSKTYWRVFQYFVCFHIPGDV